MQQHHSLWSFRSRTLQLTEVDVYDYAVRCKVRDRCVQVDWSHLQYDTVVCLSVAPCPCNVAAPPVCQLTVDKKRFPEEIVIEVAPTVDLQNIDDYSAVDDVQMRALRLESVTV